MIWMMYGRRLLWGLFLLACLSASGTTSAAETYQVTEEQLSELETVFQTLKTQQEEQQTQIETLKKQLTLSETSIAESETQLAKANQFLKESAEQSKRTEKRLKRQRAIWMIVAGVAAGYSISKS